MERSVGQTRVKKLVSSSSYSSSFFFPVVVPEPAEWGERTYPCVTTNRAFLRPGCGCIYINGLRSRNLFALFYDVTQTRLIGFRYDGKELRHLSNFALPGAYSFFILLFLEIKYPFPFELFNQFKNLSGKVM